jgi:hypothetical protein
LVLAVLAEIKEMAPTEVILLLVLLLLLMAGGMEPMVSLVLTVVMVVLVVVAVLVLAVVLTGPVPVEGPAVLPNKRTEITQTVLLWVEQEVKAVLAVLQYIATQA